MCACACVPDAPAQDSARTLLLLKAVAKQFTSQSQKCKHAKCAYICMCVHACILKSRARVSYL